MQDDICKYPHIFTETHLQLQHPAQWFAAAPRHHLLTLRLFSDVNRSSANRRVFKVSMVLGASNCMRSTSLSIQIFTETQVPRQKSGSVVLILYGIGNHSLMPKKSLDLSPLHMIIYPMESWMLPCKMPTRKNPAGNNAILIVCRHRNR